jgi:serine/threonine protein kinase
MSRFLREAQYLARIRSRHVVGVYDFDVTPAGFPYIVMEWVEGTDLAGLIDRAGRGIEQPKVVGLMLDTCEGMMDAAEERIIHRDLKPSNILIDLEGRAMVADFGLARCFEEDQRPLTQNGGGFLGTPLYMAPEQADDPRNVDTRADIYSFGATFYHALAGIPPFSGPTHHSIAMKHRLERLVPLAQRCPGINPRVSELIEKCLAKSPDDRFQSFDEVRAHLLPAVEAPGPSSPAMEAWLSEIVSRYGMRREAYLNRRLQPGIPDVYYLPRGRILRIVCGDILEQRAEALVSSDNDHLTMNAGVSASIRSAAGESVYEEAKLHVPVHLGMAIATEAGRLPAKHVIHAVTNTLEGPLFLWPPPDIIKQVVSSCLQLASELHVRTLAMPLVGTGGGGFAEDVCLDTMFHALAAALWLELTSVQEATVVIYGGRTREP